MRTLSGLAGALRTSAGLSFVTFGTQERGAHVKLEQLGRHAFAISQNCQERSFKMAP